MLDAADIVVLNPNGVCRPLLSLLPGLRADIWCDLSDYRTDDDFFSGFAAARDVTMSGLHIEEPLPVLEAMIADGKEVTVIAYGRRGSIAAAADGRIIRTRAQTGWKQVDTNGAGDTSLAGLLYAHTAGHPVEDALLIASVAAAMSVASPELARPDLSPETLEAENRRRSSSWT